jgi:D-threo-aldose 1-dehydrogenase
VFLGGVLNSGVLATGTSRHAKYNYSNAPPALLKRVRRLETVCARYRTLLHVAALRFPLAHLAVVTEVFGAQSVAEAAANIGPYEYRFPAKYGLTCKVGGLLRAAAPVPQGPISNTAQRSCAAKRAKCRFCKAFDGRHRAG